MSQPPGSKAQVEELVAQKAKFQKELALGLHSSGVYAIDLYVQAQRKHTPISGN